MTDKFENAILTASNNAEREILELYKKSHTGYEDAFSEFQFKVNVSIMKYMVRSVLLDETVRKELGKAAPANPHFVPFPDL